MEFGRPGTAGGSNKLTLGALWCSWSCVPVLATDRRGLQSKPSQGRKQAGRKRERSGAAGIGTGGIEFGQSEESDQADRLLPTEPRQRFKTQSDRSRNSAATDWPTCWIMIVKPAGGCNERAWTGSRATGREVENEGEGGKMKVGREGE